LNRASEVDIKKLKSLNHPNIIKTFLSNGSLGLTATYGCQLAEAALFQLTSSYTILYFGLILASQAFCS
jgi:hypothetical protein